MVFLIFSRSTFPHSTKNILMCSRFRKLKSKVFFDGYVLSGMQVPNVSKQGRTRYHGLQEQQLRLQDQINGSWNGDLHAKRGEGIQDIRQRSGDTSHG